MDEEGEFLTRSNMASVCLKHFQEWGWLKQDYDEALNSYVVTFPEYSQMYVELFRSLLDEQESEERESVMTIYSHLFTYHSSKEKDNEILKSALQSSKALLQMLSNMQEGIRGFFEEMTKQKTFLGIQEVLVQEMNNTDSQKYAILTTTDSFYRYKEEVKELIDQNLMGNEARKQELLQRRKGWRQILLRGEEMNVEYRAAMRQWRSCFRSIGSLTGLSADTIVSLIKREYLQNVRRLVSDIFWRRVMWRKTTQKR